MKPMQGGIPTRPRLATVKQAIAPDAEDAEGLDAYTAKFQQALSAEAAAVAEMK